jgi:hypothetical protein
MIFTMCFSKDGKTFSDAIAQATKSNKAVLFFEGIFRYVAFPDDNNCYEYTTKDEVFDLMRKKLRNDIIKVHGIDPENMEGAIA